MKAAHAKCLSLQVVIVNVFAKFLGRAARRDVGNHRQHADSPVVYIGDGA